MCRELGKVLVRHRVKGVLAKEQHVEDYACTPHINFLAVEVKVKCNNYLLTCIRSCQ